MNGNGGEWVESMGVARKIIGIKVCYYLIKIFLHNNIHFKMNSIIYCIRVYIYKVITVVITR